MYILSITFANHHAGKRDVGCKFVYFDSMNELANFVKAVKRTTDELLRYSVYEWSITTENLLLEYDSDSADSHKFYDFINNCYY